MSLCKSCGAQIDWVKVKNTGRMMPVDLDTVNYEDAENGDLLITDNGEIVRVNELQEMPNTYGRVSHFSTCPQADVWRKKSGKGAADRD